MFSRIGLTGGIGAGKSTIAQHYRSRGAYTLDYDVITRDVLAPGSVGLQAVTQLLGPETQLDDGSMNRHWVAQEVFGRPELLRRLNAIVHPLVFAEAEKRETDWLASHHVTANFGAGKGSGSRYRREGGKRQIVIHEIPLLAETGVAKWFDAIIDVEAPEDVRIERLIAHRHMSRVEAEERVRAQASSTDREAIATYVIHSDQPMDAMFAQADHIYDRLVSD
jgi:dephospho-CoA kinase